MSGISSNFSSSEDCSRRPSSLVNPDLIADEHPLITERTLNNLHPPVIPVVQVPFPFIEPDGKKPTPLIYPFVIDHFLAAVLVKGAWLLPTFVRMVVG